MYVEEELSDRDRDGAIALQAASVGCHLSHHCLLSFCRRHRSQLLSPEGPDTEDELSKYRNRWNYPLNSVKWTNETLDVDDKNIQLNNFGDHINLRVDKTRQKNANESELKYILFWNEAYGSKEYDLGFGRQPFYDNLCPETRCFATDDRNLKLAEDFDAIFFHQRSLDFKDIPDQTKRKVKSKIQW